MTNIDKGTMIKYKMLLLCSAFSGEFSYKEEKQNYSDKKQAKSDIYAGSKISQIYHKLSNISSILIESPANSIANTTDSVNTKGSLMVNKIRIIPAAISEAIDENTFRCDVRSSIDKRISFNIINPNSYCQ